MAAGPLTTLHLCRVPGAAIPVALLRLALDRPLLRRTPGITFWKLLGTGHARTFSARDADPRTWGLLAVWERHDALAAFERRSPVAAAWRALASDRWRADLALIAARGRWSGRVPFGPPLGRADAHQPVAALTRARLVPRRAPVFWRAVPPVTADLHASPGLRFAVGVGEAPIGVQGTFSIWESEAAMRAFAYRGAPHREAIERTTSVGWYAEELFARFRVLQTTGTLDGRDPLAPNRPAPTTS